VLHFRFSPCLLLCFPNRTKHSSCRPKLQAERARIAAELSALRQRLQLLAVAINRLAAARTYLGTAAGAAMEAGDRCVLIK
jgi:hypothetical protein